MAELQDAFHVVSTGVREDPVLWTGRENPLRRAVWDFLARPVPGSLVHAGFQSRLLFCTLQQTCFEFAAAVACVVDGVPGVSGLGLTVF